MMETEKTDVQSEITEKSAIEIVEVLLFSTEEPLNTAKMREVAPQLQNFDLRKMIESLNQRYRENGRTFEIQQVAGGYQMFTLPAYADIVERLYFKRQQNRLSVKALETLAIIAYKQPVTRLQIEEIRGVNVDGVIRTLLTRDLVTISGSADTPGNPFLYKTTKKFLEYFGLNSMKELPRLKELDEIVAADTEITEKFGEEFLKEIAPEILGMQDFEAAETKPEDANESAEK